MKRVLIIDENPPFREYLKTKLAESDVEVLQAIGALDGIAKIRAEIPDLVIVDYHLSRKGCFEVLRSKRADPNAANVPVIVTARQIDQGKVIALAPYNVKKVFAKPVKIDALFAALSDILQISFTIDETPGIVEVHVNEDVLFIEIAQGLNRDKLDMLRFKIMELIDLNSIKVPKLIVMLSDMVLGFADAPNLKMLLDVVTQASRAKPRNIRVLTRDDFVRKFIEGRAEFRRIEVVSNLRYAMDGLLADLDRSTQYAESNAEIIGDKLLSPGGGAEGEAMQLRFDAESRPKKSGGEFARDLLPDITVAAVDDDPVILEIIGNTFRRAGSEVRAYTSGAAFLAALDSEDFDIIFLDLLMPGPDGFAVLDILREKNKQIPVIVISSVSGRETVLRAFRQGIKSYVTKPVTSGVLIRKAIEILKPSI